MKICLFTVKVVHEKALFHLFYATPTSYIATVSQCCQTDCFELQADDFPSSNVWSLKNLRSRMRENFLYEVFGIS